jgi:hypothetical protein
MIINIFSNVNYQKPALRTGANHVADPLEDEHEEHVWSWELRDAKVLPKAQRQQAQAIKKTLLKVVTAGLIHTDIYTCWHDILPYLHCSSTRTCTQ